MGFFDYFKRTVFILVYLCFSKTVTRGTGGNMKTDSLFERIQNTNEITREIVTGDQKFHKVRMIKALIS